MRDFLAILIKQVHNDAEVETQLTPINVENIHGLTGDDARPDIRARSVWQNGQNAFFDIHVTNTNRNSQNHLSPIKILRTTET